MDIKFLVNGVHLLLHSYKCDRSDGSVLHYVKAYSQSATELVIMTSLSNGYHLSSMKLFTLNSGIHPRRQWQMHTVTSLYS